LENAEPTQQAILTPDEGRAPAGPRADTLVGSVLALLAVTVVQRLVGFGRGVIFCRWLTPEALGQWDLAFGFLLLAAPVAVLGLPGSFGRYVEYYRQRGQLRAFLRRATTWTVVFAALAVAAILLTPGWFAEQIFGDARLARLAVLAGLCLAIVIGHHFLESLLMALRRSRVVSGMQFCQSLGFACLSVALLAWWRAGPESALVAYALASLVSAAGALLWLRRALAELPDEEQAPPPWRAFWARLLPFAAWIWAANLLANLFGVIDRYMLVHCSGLDAAAALADVGNYHSSRIVPLLLIGVASLLGSILMPYLSHDWEAGRRKQVAARMNLAVKLVALALLAAGVGVLLAAPLLFNIAFAGKYDGGLAALPWTLTYCVWFGVAIVAQNYLWCCERAKLCSAALLAGLLLNVGLNLVLVPRYGLMGAVWGTAAANLLALLLPFAFSRAAGMRFDRGAWALALAPAALGFGAWPAAVALAGLLAAALRGERLFNFEEKQQLRSVARGYLGRLGKRRAVPR
jgi:O-antigen/teichoic acid export membrane protein